MVDELAIIEGMLYFPESFNDSEDREIVEDFLENIGLEYFPDDEDCEDDGDTLTFASEDGTDTLMIDQCNIDYDIDVEGELELLTPYVKKGSEVYVLHFDPGDITCNYRVRYRFNGEKWEVAVKDLLFDDEK